MRGEHSSHAITSSRVGGSSPHARGAPPPLHAPDPGRGIIPACAGSTPSRPILTGTVRDHPRMRGEHRLACSTPIERQGSSPHARGALERGRHRRNWRGIIPACAGSTARAPWCNWRLRDHPRMRGEHTSRLCSLWQSLGSSPHARGAPRACRHAACQAGIIPACAGSTSTPRWSATTRRDHPRMRGEHLDAKVERYHEEGSSPHARGAPITTVHHNRTCGIIPACAGSTGTPRTGGPSRGDHPRMRGEHSYHSAARAM